MKVIFILMKQIVFMKQLPKMQLLHIILPKRQNPVLIDILLLKDQPQRITTVVQRQSLQQIQ